MPSEPRPEYGGALYSQRFSTDPTMQGVVEPWRHVLEIWWPNDEAAEMCGSCEESWPCDAEQMRLRAIEAETRLERLRSFAEKVAASPNDTPGTRAAARYALTGSLEGVIDEMRLSSEQEPR